MFSTVQTSGISRSWLLIFQIFTEVNEFWMDPVPLYPLSCLRNQKNHSFTLFRDKLAHSLREEGIIWMNGPELKRFLFSQEHILFIYTKCHGISFVDRLLVRRKSDVHLSSCPNYQTRPFLISVMHVSSYGRLSRSYTKCFLLIKQGLFFEQISVEKSHEWVKPRSVSYLCCVWIYVFLHSRMHQLFQYEITKN